MQRKKLLTLMGSVCLVLILAVLPVTACAQPAPVPAPAPAPTPAPVPAPAPLPPKAEPIELGLVTFVDTMNSLWWYFQQYMDTVNEKSKGELTIKHVGGPEVVKIWDLAKAVEGGVFDMGIIYTPAYRGIVPAAPALGYSWIEPWEERELGVWDIMREEHEKGGLYFIGRVAYSTSMAVVYIHLKEPVETPYDLVGKKIGGFGTPWWIRDGYGGIPVRMPDEEFYTALERGLIDGVNNSLGSQYDVGAHEMAKYVIDHPVNTSNRTLFMNLDKWNSLPKHLQDLLKQTIIDLEPEWVEHYKEQYASDRKRLTDAGVTFFKFSKADEEWWYDRHSDLSWKAVAEEAGPEIASKLRELVGR